MHVTHSRLLCAAAGGLLAAALLTQATEVRAERFVCRPTGGGFQCCSAPSTLSQICNHFETAVFAECVATTTPRNGNLGSTTFEIRHVLHTPLRSIDRGSRITVDFFEEGKRGDSVLLLASGSNRSEVKWIRPTRMSADGYQYLGDAPSVTDNPRVRLTYFIQFLEHPDPAISNDAYAELVEAPVNVLDAAARSFPRDKLRRWVADTNLPVMRQSGYGMMLGMCGDADDSRLLEKLIVARDPDREVGIEGVIFGYLLLAGESGLAKIEEARLANPDASDGDVYAAVMAIRHYWNYGNGKITQENLQRAIRLLLDRPAFADGAIKDLGRWKDWSVQGRLMQLYGAKDFDDKITKRAIICYMIASTRDVPDGENLPRHAADGSNYLNDLREKDQELVKQTERFFFLH
jgi:hypothetical protein